MLLLLRERTVNGTGRMPRSRKVRSSFPRPRSRNRGGPLRLGDEPSKRNLLYNKEGFQPPSDRRLAPLRSGRRIDEVDKPQKPRMPNPRTETSRNHRVSFRSTIDPLSLSLYFLFSLFVFGADNRALSSFKPTSITCTLGCYRDQMSQEQAFVWGKGNKDTPHIDSLAKDGVLYQLLCLFHENARLHGIPWVSGLYPQPLDARNNMPLKDSIVTFAEVLCKDTRLYLGKWHLDGNAKPGWGPARKFVFDNRLCSTAGIGKIRTDRGWPASRLRKK